MQITPQQGQQEQLHQRVGNHRMEPGERFRGLQAGLEQPEEQRQHQEQHRSADTMHDGYDTRHRQPDYEQIEVFGPGFGHS